MSFYAPTLATDPAAPSTFDIAAIMKKIVCTCRYFGGCVWGKRNKLKEKRFSELYKNPSVLTIILSQVDLEEIMLQYSVMKMR